jgi:hypothetical protein
LFANIGNFGNNTVIFSIRKSINRDFNREMKCCLTFLKTTLICN